MRRTLTRLFPLLTSLAIFSQSPYSIAQQEEEELTGLSIEELMEVEVTTVSRHEEKRVNAPAAIAVIKGDEIIQHGLTSIPEALRLAPGLHVARVSSSSWAVSSRGFSSLNSAKLLVLIDGRSVYTPLFSGVFWDVQDLLLEDIDRIEVIRGPGSTLWGANAMNGVVNIITKNSTNTQDSFVQAGGGTFERAFGSVRQGGKIGERGHYRVFGKFFDRASGYLPGDVNADDDWQMGRLGMRTDWQLSPEDTLSFQSNLYLGNVGQVSPSIIVIGRPGAQPPLNVTVAGGFGLATWQRTFNSRSDLQLRLYYDRTYRDDPSYTDHLHTYELDFQYRLPLPGRQELIWGAAFRLMNNENIGKGLITFDPPQSVDKIVSGFVQDQITIIPNLRFTAGTKLEQNDFSGVEVQPSARFSWNLTEGHTLWGAVSRAVRVPTRYERDLLVDAADPATANPLPRLFGNKSLNSEKLTSYELGYRLPVSRQIFADLSTFFNSYTGLMTLELDPPYADPTGKIIIPLEHKNAMIGNTRGVELTTTFEPENNKTWNLKVNYTYFLLQLKPEAADINRAIRFVGATPAHQVQLLANLNFTDNLQLNPFFRYISSLTNSADMLGGGAPDYATMDIRIGWQLKKNMNLAIVGQNLFQSHHLEFPDGTEVARGVYGKFTLDF